MPYRRLPNTDVARLRAIEAGLELGKRTAITKLAFSQQTLEKLQTFYPHFLGAIRQLNISKQNQFDRSKEYGEIFRKAKLYLSHFLQVVNFDNQFSRLLWGSFQQIELLQKPVLKD